MTTTGSATVVEEPALACGEVRGGNDAIDTVVELPGLRVALHSRPLGGGLGGDVHGLSSCGSGLMSRICLADVVGHGERVGAVAAHIHGLLRRHLDRPDHRTLLARLNRVLLETEGEVMTTAALLTYFAPNGALAFTYAGHPPGWLYRAREGTWRPMLADGKDPEAAGLVDGPLAVDAGAVYTRTRLKVRPGDRLLLVTDGVIEMPVAGGGALGYEAVTNLLAEHRAASLEQLAAELRGLLRPAPDADPARLDDRTFVLIEVRPGPPGPVLWNVLRNRLRQVMAG